MKLNYGLVLAFTFLRLACQPTVSPAVTIIDREQIITLKTTERVPSALLAQGGIALHQNDTILLDGLPTAHDQPIASESVTNSAITLQIRRAVPVKIISPDGEQQIQTSAFTVGEALQEALIWLRAYDKVTPSLTSPISDSPLIIQQSPSRQLSIITNGRTININSSAQIVGEALAEAGIPLIGLDYSQPPPPMERSA
jgi:hypothetical protein